MTGFLVVVCLWGDEDSRVSFWGDDDTGSFSRMWGRIFFPRKFFEEVLFEALFGKSYVRYTLFEL